MKRGLLARWMRFLPFLADRQELQGPSWRQFLAATPVATWLAGMGCYWDHPLALPLQNPTSLSHTQPH